MRIIFRSLLLSSLVLLSTYSCLGNQWRGIIPLRSTRSDIIKLLGTPMHRTNEGESFDVDIGTVTFEWIDPNCLRKYPIDPALPITDADLVLNISITLRVPTARNELGIPESLVVAMNCTGTSAKGPWINCSFWSMDGGLAYSTSKNGVTSVWYGPTNAEFKTWKEQHPACASNNNYSLNRSANSVAFVRKNEGLIQYCPPG